MRCFTVGTPGMCGYGVTDSEVMGSVVVGSGVHVPLVRGSVAIRFTAGSSGAGGSVVNAVINPSEVIGSGYVFGCGWLECQCIRGDGFHGWWFKCLVKCVRSNRFRSWWLWCLRLASQWFRGDSFQSWWFSVCGYGVIGSEDWDCREGGYGVGGCGVGGAGVDGCGVSGSGVGGCGV